MHGAEHNFDASVSSDSFSILLLKRSTRYSRKLHVSSVGGHVHPAPLYLLLVPSRTSGFTLEHVHYQQWVVVSVFLLTRKLSMCPNRNVTASVFKQSEGYNFAKMYDTAFWVGWTEWIRFLSPKFRHSMKYDTFLVSWVLVSALLSWWISGSRFLRRSFLVFLQFTFQCT